MKTSNYSTLSRINMNNTYNTVAVIPTERFHVVSSHWNENLEWLKNSGYSY